MMMYVHIIAFALMCAIKITHSQNGLYTYAKTMTQMNVM